MGLAEILNAGQKLERGEPAWLYNVSWGVHIGEAFVLFAFVMTAFNGSTAAVAGAQSLVSGDAAWLFWGGAVVLGLILPMAIAWIAKGCRMMAFASGVCAILGALALRAAVLFAGYFEPVIW